jgi:hypothetical protein
LGLRTVADYAHDFNRRKLPAPFVSQTLAAPSLQQFLPAQAKVPQFFSKD